MAKSKKKKSRELSDQPGILIEVVDVLSGNLPDLPIEVLLCSLIPFGKISFRSYRIRQEFRDGTSSSMSEAAR